MMGLSLADWLLVLPFLTLYFLPAIVAWSRGHENRYVIAVVNLLVGWTVIGWLVVMYWAFVGPVGRTTPVPVVLVALFLAACARPPQLTRAEWLAMTTRTFPGVTAAQAYEAAEKLFRLADPTDVQIGHAHDRMVVARRWLLYLVIAAASGTDFWTIRAVDTPEGALVTVEAATQQGAVSATAVPVTSGAVGIGTMTTPTTGGHMIDSPALYDLFWARMAFLTGRSTEWRTCQDQEALIESAKIRGHLAPLCTVADDNAPEGVPVVDRTIPPQR